MTALRCLLGQEQSESSHKKGSPFNSALGLTTSWDVPLQPRFLRLLALSPSCLFSSICLPCPSPKEASIKSPLKTRTGLDSYKLEQNNLFPKPHCGLVSPCPFVSVPYCQRQKPKAPLWDRERFLFTDAHYIDVSWFHQATHLDAIPPAASHCLSSSAYGFTPNASATTGQTAWQSAELQPLLWLSVSARATM